MSNHDSTVGQVVSDAAVYIYCFNRKGVNDTLPILWAV